MKILKWIGIVLGAIVVVIHVGAALMPSTYHVERVASIEASAEKIYPLIENGRVVADVEVAGLSSRFVDARVLVRLPVGQRQALLVPEALVHTAHGLDFPALDNLQHDGTQHHCRANHSIHMEGM